LKRVALALIGILGGILACSPDFTPPTAPPAPKFDPLVYDAPIGPLPDFVGETLIDTVRRDEPVSVTLARIGVTASEIDTIVRSLLDEFDFRKARPGNTVEIQRDASGNIVWFRFTAGARSIYHSARGPDGKYFGVAELVHVLKQTVFVEGVIEHSLYLAMAAAGESPVLTMNLVDLFAWDIDFYTETQKGDRFKLIVEKEYVAGKFAGYGKVIGAEYAHPGPNNDYPKKTRAFHYVAADGIEGYYTEEGTAVKKAFLKSPIQFASITSGFGMRFHPILEYRSQHKGIDYGAPKGTAVQAVGDGKVLSAGPRGGYGNMVAIRHPNGYETRYAHLSAFGKGIRAGAHVSQKQVIGLVGSTGLSTGPHLHFEVWVNGNVTNPLKVALPPAPPILSDEMPAFHAAIGFVVSALDEGNATLAASAR